VTDEQIIALAGYIVDGISPYLAALLAAVGMLIGAQIARAVSWWKW